MELMLYKPNDLVRVDCHDCHGCSSCCRDMGDSIKLDPYDAWQLQREGKPIAGLLQDGTVALTVWEGMILPHLQMNAQTGGCSFLSREGRCTIHAYRPGICRLFPLGRNFTESEMTYFLLEDACENHQRSKVRVSRWIGIEPAAAYHDFVKEWHDFRKEMLELLAGAQEESAKQLNLYLLQTFYLNPYDPAQNFYGQFAQRVARIRSAFS